MLEILRPTYVEINLDNINHNIKQIKNFIKKDTKLAIVVKANGYGHGSVEICKSIDENHVGYICVATLSEAMELRTNNIKLPILVMGYTPNEYVKLAIENNITITLFLKEQVEYVNRVGKEIDKSCKVHIKIDTGFNRLGFKIDDELINTIKYIMSIENIYIEGIFSHLALKDIECDHAQFNKFKNILNEITKINDIPIKHICDSIGLVAYSDFHMDMVRVGASIYGYNSRKSELDLKPCMTLKSKIIQVKAVNKGEGISYDYSYIADKNMNIGVIPCGYADGIPRMLSNRGYVTVNRKRCNILGKICMDQLMIDISNLNENEYNDDVILYGENGPDLLEVANLANTNRNEILSSVSRRVDRVYIKDNKIKRTLNYIY